MTGGSDRAECDGMAQAGDLQKGRYRASLRSASALGADLERAQRLRHDCFIRAAGLPMRDGGRDHDPYDPHCLHLLVEDVLTGQLLATCRLMLLGPADLHRAYGAQFYDLRPLAALPAPFLEIGRFCTAPDQRDPDILRLAWARIGALVDAEGVGLMFGCSSFMGNDPAPYAAAFDLLAARHLGPAPLRPRPLRGQGTALTPQAPPAPEGMRVMPPLLRAYLAMGAWVGADLVRDSDLHTLHVFTAVETRHVSPARARSLRRIFGGDQGA